MSKPLGPPIQGEVAVLIDGTAGASAVQIVRREDGGAAHVAFNLGIAGQPFTLILPPVQAEILSWDLRDAVAKARVFNESANIDDDDDTDEETEDDFGADADNADPLASEEGWNRIDSIGNLFVRSTPEHAHTSTPTLLELRAGPAGGSYGIVRLRVGKTVTRRLLGRIEDVLFAADDADRDEGPQT